MLAVLHSFLVKLAGYWQVLIRYWGHLSSILCACYPQGRDALLRRAEARTKEAELAVAKQRLEDMIELLGKAEVLKEPQSRQIATTAISAAYGYPPPPNKTTARRPSPPPHPSLQRSAPHSDKVN
jgi:hypothetical protein